MPRRTKGVQVRTALREEAFVKSWFALGFKGTQAAIAAGCPAKTADTVASEMLRRDSVQVLIAKEHAALMRRHDLSIDKMMDILKPIAHATMEHYVTVDREGQPHLDFSQLNAEQWSAIAEIIVDEYTEGRGEDAKAVKRVRLKLHDKLGAVDKVLKVMGAYIGKGGGDSNAAPLAGATINIDNRSITVHDAAKGYEKLIEG